MPKYAKNPDDPVPSCGSFDVDRQGNEAAGKGQSRSDATLLLGAS